MAALEKLLYYPIFQLDKLNSDEVCDSPESLDYPKLSFQASDRREPDPTFFSSEHGLFSLAVDQWLLQMVLEDFSQEFARSFFHTGISRHPKGHEHLYRPLGGHVVYGLVFPTLLVALGDVSVFRGWSCAALQCWCEWPEQLYSTSLLLIQPGTRAPERASWGLQAALLFFYVLLNTIFQQLRLVALEMTRSHVAKEASYALLVNWFFQSLVCFCLFIYIFSRIFKIPHKFSQIPYCSYKLY